MARRRRRRANGDDEWIAVAVLLVIWLCSQLQARGILVIWATTGALAFASLFLIAAQRRKQRRNDGNKRAIAATLKTDISALSPDQFEERIEALLRDMGWSGVKRVGGRGDRGVDLRGEYQGQTYVVQCKHKPKVTPSEMRDFVGTRLNQKADRGLFVTSGLFSNQARLEARENPLELWDGDDLAERIHQVEEGKYKPDAEELRRQSMRRVGRFRRTIILVNAIAIIWALMVTAMAL